MLCVDLKTCTATLLVPGETHLQIINKIIHFTSVFLLSKLQKSLSEFALPVFQIFQFHPFGIVPGA